MRLHKGIMGLLFLTAIMTAGFAMGWPEPRILQEPEAQGTPEEAATESVVSEEEKVDVEESGIEMREKRPWQAPNYAGQSQALAWNENIFTVPEGLKERVEFWKRIYTKYTTDQGILHDSLHIGIVYTEVDFNSILADPQLSDRQKRKARKKLVDDKKKEIRERLLKLAQIEKALPKDADRKIPPAGLEGEDLRVWYLFAHFDEPNKFSKATERKRLRFQLGQRDRFIQGIYYSGRYLTEMERIFTEKGLPRELTRLPFVESSFNVKARSRVGASGIWQFMRYTGRKFMRINYAVDERNDPLRATVAAARLFRLNFDITGQWPLAVTAYNHGAGGVNRMVKKFHTNKIEELVDERHGRFGFASANFYSCFLAAVEVEKNAKQYFGDVFWDVPGNWQEIALTKGVQASLLKKWFNGNAEAAKEANPHLQKPFWLGYTQVGNKDMIRVPKAQYEVAMQDLSALRTTSGVGGAVRDGVDYYMIGHGETLSEIAMQIGVSVTSLKELNGIDNPRSLRAGQKILVPTKGK